MKVTKRYREPARRLTPEDAAQVWLLHWAGELNHRIAARFDTNQGRISEVLRGKRHPGSEAVAYAILQGQPANLPGAPSQS
jgi:hypothetical protein